MASSRSFDAALEERFVSWLRGRHPELVEATLDEDLRRFAELEGPSLDGPAFASRLTHEDLSDAQADRLVRLDAAFAAFLRSEPDETAWVGRERRAGDDEAIVWIDPSGMNALRPPTGLAPRLLPPGAPPAPTRRPSSGPRARFADFMVPLGVLGTLALALVLAAGSRSELETIRHEVAEELRRFPAGSARAERVAHQAALAAWLVETRRGQRALVNETCEGGDWCRQHLLAVEGSLRLAERLQEDAGRWKLAGGPAARPSLPPGLLRGELTALEALSGAGASETGGDGRQRVVEAELAHLRAALAELR